MQFIYDTYEAMGKAKSRVVEMNEALEGQGFKFRIDRTWRGNSITVIAPDEFGTHEAVSAHIRAACIKSRQEKRAEEE